MKSLSFGYKVLFFFNNIFAILLLFAYVTSYISPASFPLLAILNFSIPVLWMINFCFALIWLLKLKRHIFLSLIVIALGWFHFVKLFVFSKADEVNDEGLKVMSYNIMQFYNAEDKKKSTQEDIKAFVTNENPAILCLQELKKPKQPVLNNFNYKTNYSTDQNLQTAIFSQYPILRQKLFEFGISNNSAVMADILVNKDTLRVFSVHFESLNIEMIKNQPEEKMMMRLEKTFKRQIDQFEMLNNYINSSPYPVIFCADMNNTALSYLYRQVTNEGLKDTFLESGYQYGKTYKFNILPVRIDMIFIDKNLKSLNFKNYTVNYSDHFPVMAEIQL